jgi:carbon monoxide dehydrogenase subunit G
MRVAREVALTVPTERVWEALWDVPRMVACVPGCVEAREVEPRRRYRARMSQKVGPIALSVPLDILVTQETPGRLAVEARGRDGLLAAEVQMSVRLGVEAAEAGSRLAVEAEGRVLGKLGALGAGVIQRRAEELIDEFTARLVRYMGGLERVPQAPPAGSGRPGGAVPPLDTGG